MKSFILYFALLATLLSSCTGFEKIRKSSDIDFKYRKAFEFYQMGKYQVAADLFDDIVTGFRGTGRGDSAFFYQAMSHYQLGGKPEWLEASILFNNFSKNFYSPLNEEADYMNVKCYYYLSPRPSLDQSQTYEAVKNAQIFLGKYLNSTFRDEVLKIRNELEERLVEKSYLSAKLYFDVGDYKASITALDNSLQEYPESGHREELMFMLLKASFELADNSIQAKKLERFQAALDEYYAYESEFSGSAHQKEAAKLLDSIQAYLAGKTIEE